MAHEFTDINSDFKNKSFEKNKELWNMFKSILVVL